MHASQMKPTRRVMSTLLKRKRMTVKMGILQHLWRRKWIHFNTWNSCLSALQGLTGVLHPCSSSPEVSNPGSTSQCSPLCLTYTIKEGTVSSSSDMPRGVFCRLAVKLIRQEWDIVKDESSCSLLKFEGDEFTIFLQEFLGHISIIPQTVVKFSSPSELHAACVSLRSTVTQCLSVSAEEVLGSQFSSHANLAIGFTCNCKEKVVPHLGILTPSKQGAHFK